MAQSDSDSHHPEPSMNTLTHSNLDILIDTSHNDENDRFLISDLCQLLEEYIDSEHVAEVYKAYLFGAQMHEGQKRVSGEPYIYHPVAVARIMAEMHMDYQSIIAALLHDVIEDTDAVKEEIAEQFGDQVADLVDGVSKLTQIQFRSKAEAQAENFSKMLLAMAQDIRVIIIKLADRLHNMRTLGAMRPDKRRRISKETMEIYAPIANRLGIYQMRHELLDLATYNAYPMRYTALDNACKALIGHRKELFSTIKLALKGRLKEVKISTKIKYRKKNIHSIYRKMSEKKLSFKEITDVHGVRIITKSVDACYRVLGVCHNLYKPIPGKFKDYIAIPKANGYQSLHTSLFGPHGIPIEIQIRSTEMDQFAKSGIAAHWLYKDSSLGVDTDSRATEWLKGLLELQQNTSSSLEFLENVKVDLFPDEVYVFTPKGDIKKLPRGSTIVDFAYSVHSQVGHTCVAARIDHKMMPLSATLYNGQTVQVITSKSSRPHPNWLDFIITARARTQIRHYLKSINRSEAISLGKRLLQQAIIQFIGSDIKYSEQHLNEVLRQYQLDSEDELLAEIGLGNRMASLVVKSLFDTLDEDDDVTQFDETGKLLAIKGTEGMVLSYAKCCAPIPGDRIVGFLSSGKGIVVHTEACKNITKEQKNDNRVMDIQWSSHVEGEYSTNLRVRVINQRGVLAKLAAVIANTDSNIENLEISNESGVLTTIDFIVSVQSRVHLARIMRKLKHIKVVNKIWRI